MTSGELTHASSISFLEGNGSVFATSVNDSLYSITLPNNANFSVTIFWVGAYYWQSGSQTYVFPVNSSSTTLDQSWDVQTPASNVHVTGTVSTSGWGTQANMITFASGHNQSFTQNVENAQYNISLPNFDTYTTSVTWSGSYSWQSGNASSGVLQAQVENDSSSILRNWNIQTPNSQILVSGIANVTGTATKTTSVSFAGEHGSAFNVATTNNQYSVILPNSEMYNVTIFWSGAYSWQVGSFGQLYNLTEGSGVVSTAKNFLNNPTPDSTIVVNGTVSTTGSRTTPAEMTFSSTSAGNYSTNVLDSTYSLTLPNLMNYTVSISWNGQYSWQNGITRTGQFNVQQSAASASFLTKNWTNVQTSNAMITVSGSVSTSGSGTSIISLSFVSAYGTYPVNLSYDQYSVVLPNLANYTVVAKWAGSFTWQNGSSYFILGLNAGVGVSTYIANWNIPTPNSMITISGNVVTSSQGRIPYLVRFVSANDAINTTAQINETQFAILLPNDMNYTVTIYWASLASSGVTNAGEFELYGTPGVSTINVTWTA